MARERYRSWRSSTHALLHRTTGGVEPQRLEDARERRARHARGHEVLADVIRARSVIPDAVPLRSYLAWAAYRFVPLYDAQTCVRLGYPPGRQAERLRILCDAYGLDERDALLPTVCERIGVLYDTARTWGEEGRPGWRDVWRDTRGEQWLRGLRNVEAQRSNWQRSL